jgi:outer membrane receptor protein involved in Fe transport
MTFASRWRVTLSGRFNRTTIDNRDRIVPGGGPGSLDGEQTFGRFNPAAGITFSPSASTTLYASYGEGSRAPSSIELGCADPADPCKLPNAMAGDPPLKQVVTRTVEGGIRGGVAKGDRFGWSAGAFRAENSDDILFVSSSSTGFGYFKNFGRTRRQGVELSASARIARASASIGYTYLDATYQSAETLGGTGNSTNALAVAGQRGFSSTIVVAPGNRLPLVPAHMLKASADVDVAPRVSLDLDLVAMSSAFVRGNEDNAHAPDGTYYLGPGTTPGYAVTNLGATFRAAPRVRVIARVDNVFDTHYETAGQLGPAGFTSAGTFVARPLPAANGEFPIAQTTFYTPGAPRLFRLSLRVDF